MINRAVGWAFRSGVRKGVAGGSNAWLIVAVAAGAVKLMRRPSRPNKLMMQIKPGERYLVVCGDEASLRASQ